MTGISRPAQAAIVPLVFTVNMSEPVNVVTTGGTPYIQLNIGGVADATKRASYTAGTGTAALSFSYTPAPGDVDLDGITLVSPVELNGGTLSDISGNPITNRTFTLPDTSGVRIDYPSLSMDFTNGSSGRYTLNGTAYNSFSSFLSAAGGTFTNANGTFFNSSGTLQTASTNTPRLDHDPVTHQPKGILIEDGRTNLLVRSAEFDNGAWVKSQTNITANAASAPDGTMTADKIIATTTSSEHSVYRNIGALLTVPYTVSFSAFLKAADYNFAAISLSNNVDTAVRIRVDLQTGSVTSAPTSSADWTVLSYAVTPVGNGWYRIVLNVTKNTSTGGTGSVEIFPLQFGGGTSYVGDNSSGIYAWGAQLEQGSFQTSYVPTSGSAVTRTSDRFSFLSGAGLSAMQTTNGTFFVETGPMNGGSYNKIISNASSGLLERANTSNEIGTIGVNVAPNYLITTLGSGTLLQNNVKSAVAWSAAGRSLIGANGPIVSDTGTMAPRTEIHLGSRALNGNYIFGYIRNFKYYPARVASPQLQLLTQ